MKRLLAVVAMMSGMALADTVSTPVGNTFVNIPAPLPPTSPANTPYWNNVSIDGPNLNIGDFVTNVNVAGFGGVTANPAGSQYLANTAVNNNAQPTSFSLVRSLSSINVTILYQNSSANSGAGGTAFGIYDVNNCTFSFCPLTTIFSSGTIPGKVGVSTPVSTAGISGSGTYGFWATACEFPAAASTCFTFFSNTALDPNVANAEAPSTILEGTGNPHQHFALFTLNGNATTFYLGFENSLTSTGFAGTTGTEALGDFNDVIFQISTNGGGGAVPEPATLSMMGLGLLGLGLMGRRRQQK